MTRSDAAKLIGIIVTAYPNYDRFRREEHIKAAVDLWAMMFEADSTAIVGLATKKHIATCKWPPSVAEIREIMLEMRAPDLIAPDEAWLSVSDCLELGGEHGSTGLLELLPPLIARVVESVGYHNLYDMQCGSHRGSKPGMARAAFMSIYEPLYERARKREMTPADVVRQIEDIARASSSGEKSKLKAIYIRRAEKESSEARLLYRLAAARAERRET